MGETMNTLAYQRGQEDAETDAKFSTQTTVDMLHTTLKAGVRRLLEQSSEYHKDTQRSYLLGYVETYGQKLIEAQTPPRPESPFTVVGVAEYDRATDDLVYLTATNKSDDGADG